MGLVLLKVLHLSQVIIRTPFPFPPDEPQMRKPGRQTGDRSLWGLSPLKGCCSPPGLIFHKPLSGSLLTAAPCVPGLHLFTGTMCPALGSFPPGLLSMRRCSEPEPPLRAILSVPVLGIVPSASPLSIHESGAHAPSQAKGKASFDVGECPSDHFLHHCGKNRHGNTLYFEICGVYSEETLWLRRKCRQENRSGWFLMQLRSAGEGREDLSGSEWHKEPAENPSVSFERAGNLSIVSGLQCLFKT